MNDVPDDETLRQILTGIRTIAVVGASRDPDKQAHQVPAYLKDAGFRVIPVSPVVEELFDERAYPNLPALEIPVDVVQVFRPSDEAPGIARDAAAVGASVLWLQPGITSEEAGRIAQQAEMTFVSGICMRSTHARLLAG